MNLVLGYNGLQRIEGKEHAGNAAQRSVMNSPLTHELMQRFSHAGGGNRGGGMFSENPGITRLFEGSSASRSRGCCPQRSSRWWSASYCAVVLPDRPGPRRLHPVRDVLLVDGIVLSYMKSNPHPYYSLAIAPPIAALVGLGVAQCVRDRHRVPAVMGAGGNRGRGGRMGVRADASRPDVAVVAGVDRRRADGRRRARDRGHRVVGRVVTDRSTRRPRGRGLRPR